MQEVTLLMSVLRIFINVRYGEKFGDGSVAFLFKNCYHNDSEKKTFFQMFLWKIDSYSLTLHHF